MKMFIKEKLLYRLFAYRTTPCLITNVCPAELYLMIKYNNNKYNKFSHISKKPLRYSQKNNH